MFSPMIVHTTMGSLVRLTLSRIGNITDRSPCPAAIPEMGTIGARGKFQPCCGLHALAKPGTPRKAGRWALDCCRDRCPGRTSRSERKMTAAMEMIYVADPMCSWCYGFAPVIDALAQRFEEELPLRLMLGGLRAGNSELMRAADKDYVRQAWIKVAAATGQPFDMSF